MSARMALQGLHRRAAIVLRAATSVPNFKRKMANMNRGAIETASVGCSFKQRGAMEIIAVSGKNREQSAMWTRMLEDYYYLGAGRLRGAQDAVFNSQSEAWTVRGCELLAATRRLACRDKWIGWNETALRTNLQQVICNSRFLIVPNVKVPHLASHVLSQMLRRVSRDWRDQYGYELMLVETLVDPAKFAGVCYRLKNRQPLVERANASRIGRSLKKR